MKNRNQDHSDNWATPPAFYNALNKCLSFDFDPCPFLHNIDEWDGLTTEWGKMNWVNPPYTQKLKEAFICKAVEELHKGKTSVCLIPASTSTKLFHETIAPNAELIMFPKGRIPFIGVNTKGEYTNWHLWDKEAPSGCIHVKNSGMHDSMLVVFAPKGSFKYSLSRIVSGWAFSSNENK